MDGYDDQPEDGITMDDLDIENGDEWKVIEAYFTSSTHVIVQQQLDSFDTFLLASVQEIIKDAEVVIVKCDPKNPSDRVCYIFSLLLLLLLCDYFFIF